MLEIIAVFALSAQLLAPYLVWPNRWNIPAHLQAGFCVTAYVIPGLFTDVWSLVPEKTVSLFTAINVVGAILLCSGVLIGAQIEKHMQRTNLSFLGNSLLGTTSLILRVLPVVGAAVVGIYLAYWIMGFIPMFAADPFAAKQFKGEYRDLYYRAAYLFRFSFSVIVASIPLVLILAWEKRSLALMVLAFFAFVAIFISLARGATATGLLIFLGVLAARQQIGMRWYIPLVLIIFPLGSVFYYLLGEVLGVGALGRGYNSGSLSDFISSGAPDISDQLNWLYGFARGNFYSWGRTIYGGLIPGNYEWNPSVWSISYFDVGADISEVITGGLRLSAAEWGYANFGWTGVVLLPFLSGLFNGMILSKLKRGQPHMDIIQFSTALLLYNTLGLQITQFYFLSIHNIPSIAVAIYFWRSNSTRRGPLSGAASPRPPLWNFARTPRKRGIR